MVGEPEGGVVCFKESDFPEGTLTGLGMTIGDVEEEEEEEWDVRDEGVGGREDGRAGAIGEGLDD